MREFEKNPERMLKLTEQYLKKQDQDERQGITSAQVIGKAEDLPDKDEDQMEDTGARGSADPAPGSEEDVSMSNVVYSITANVAPKQRFDEWEDKYKQRLRRGLNDDVKHMNEALAKEGFEHSIIEMYSPKRVNGIGEMLGLIPGLSLDLIENDVDGQPWDFNVKEKRDKAQRLINEKKALLVIGSPMCSAFSQIQGLNFSRMTPEDVEKVIMYGKRHLKFCAELYKIQHSNGLYFLHEHPYGASSWNDDKIKDLFYTPGI